MIQKKSLQKNGLIASEMSQKYSKLYYDMMTSSAQAKKTNRDLYTQELIFVQAAQDQIALHRSLGKEVLQAWKDVFKLEQNRMGIIHKALSMFLTKHEQIFTQNFSIQFPKKLLDNYKPVEEAQIYFSITQTLPQEKINNLKTYYQREQVTIDDVSNYLEHFLIDKRKNSPLILKTIRGERDTGGITKSFKPCKLLFTVDQFLLMIDQNQNNAKKANVIMKVDNLTLNQRKDKLVEIIEKVPGILFNQTKKQLMRFTNSDQFMELQLYLEMRQMVL
eukprot:TRINITY_DN4934_c0_g1_i3.p1 TRINITY_DN4934_c0_g1~~TRINITY_DN4934_c0_g1_i3.p1  ORF type:complete len:276 (+),score=37.72 TRINITY_DN4934_c0_g1_i3:866-1693(+)